MSRHQTVANQGIERICHHCTVISRMCPKKWPGRRLQCYTKYLDLRRGPMPLHLLFERPKPISHYFPFSSFFYPIRRIRQFHHQDLGAGAAERRRRPCDSWPLSKNARVFLYGNRGRAARFFLPSQRPPPLLLRFFPFYIHVFIFTFFWVVLGRRSHVFR